MSITAAELEARFEANMSGLNRGAAAAERRMQQSERHIGGTTGKMKGHFRKLGVAGAAGLATLGAAAGVAGFKMVGLASDAGETSSKLQVVFGKQLPGLSKNLDAFATATGASRFALREQAGSVGALLGPMKLGEKATADMSEKVVKLATDLGSFNNVNADEALLALRSGLTGEAEPLKQFGILMNDAAVKTEGLRLGLVKGKQELTEQQKVQARYSLILQQTTQAQGDAARTAGSMANQSKALKNNVLELATELGQKLIPHALKATEFLNGMFNGGAGSGAAKQFVGILRGAAGVIENMAAKLKHAWQTDEQFRNSIIGMTEAAKRMAPVVGKIATTVLPLLADGLILAVKAAGKLYDVFAGVGLGAISMVRGVLTAAKGMANGFIASLIAMLKATSKLNPAAGEMIKAAQKARAGMNKEFGEIDAKIVRVRDNIISVQMALQGLDGSTATVTIKERRQRAPNPSNIGGAVVAAKGGAIKGPGTGTSDDIPAWLSNGEFVVRADGSNLGDAMRFYGVRGLKKGGPAALNRRPAGGRLGLPPSGTVGDRFQRYADTFNLQQASLEGAAIDAESTLGVRDDNTTRRALYNFWNNVADKFKIWRSKPLNMTGAKSTDRANIQQAINSAMQARNQYANPLKEFAGDDTGGGGGGDVNADLQAQLDQANLRANNAQANFNLSQQQFGILNGSNDIGFAGGRNALQAAGGAAPVINIQTLIPSDPRTLEAVASAANSGNSMGQSANTLYSGAVRLAT